MNTDITTHDFHGNGVRIHADGDTVEYCARDIATTLGYKDTINAIKQHCRGVVNRHPIVDSLGRTQEATFITEGDVYRLIVSSQLPAAMEFEHWLFDEVVPSIRKHGGYLAGQEHMSPEEMVAASMRYLESKIAEQKQQLEEQKPKVLFAEAVTTSKNSILIGELAKILKQNGAHGMGQNRLFERLRQEGYLCRQHGENWNLPTQRSMDMGLFEIKKNTIMQPDGTTRVTRTVKVTGKGQQYFINKILGTTTR
ncbi:phage antirepressor [Bifidobacterium animalis]|uniref:phage antirepressor n=1 Tax=Bifidobacterium animalis TaxID=28025 RepID=UPI001020DF33|nr:phage antirepressor KilAC domain-containing protein [Bifidobacterium animalis]RYN04965.1 antirepressor [Bifidobacterium animalis subsp. lactis]